MPISGARGGSAGRRFLGRRQQTGRALPGSRRRSLLGSGTRSRVCWIGAQVYRGGPTARFARADRAPPRCPTAHVHAAERNFANGYIAHPGGISKAYDLVSRRHLNTDMPWWNLPETIRSAALAWNVASNGEERARCLEILRDTHNAFRHFIRTDLHLMAYQTRSIEGKPIDAIPATADADPGYHTGLSLIDAIEIL